MAATVNFNVGSHVWVEEPESSTTNKKNKKKEKQVLPWIDGEVFKIDGQGIHIQTTNGKKVVAEVSKVLPKDNELLPAGVDDMTKLKHVHEPGVLQNLASRYGLNKIYTYAGNILIAINPFQRLPHLYDAHMMEQYKEATFGELSPHVFTVADVAYRSMMKEGKSTSIIVSGESGAGKTETTKLLMRYLAYVGGQSGTAGPTIEKRLLESNVVLEAFGNAKTVQNQNSSRFGKFVEIQFDKSGRISGAAIRTYLLERSRVCQISDLERNYHCFYRLCAAPSDDIAKYRLESPKSFHYLNQSDCYELDGVSDAHEYLATRGAMDFVGISKQEQEEIFQILAAILHLGNIEFSNGKEIDSSIIKDEKPRFHLNMAAELLMCNPQFLEDALINHIMVTPTEVIRKNIDPVAAVFRRDSLAKTIYSGLFNWIVDKINISIGQDPQSKSIIGVLDINGFECVKCNSFEQFCTNFTNEKLQQHFNQHIFKMEQEEYTKEEFKWNYIEFVDNQDVLDLIEKKPGGIIALLDETCMFPKSTHETFAQKLYTTFKNNKHFSKPKLSRTDFTISHCAGKVTYKADQFLDKNKDYVVAEHQELLSALKCLPTPPELEESSKFSSSNVLPKKNIVPLKKSFSKVLSKKFSFSGKHQELPSALKCLPPPPEPEESSKFSSSDVLPKKPIVPLKKSFSEVLYKKFSFSGKHQELPSALKCPPPPPEPEESSKFSSSNVLPKKPIVPLKKSFSKVLSKKFSFSGKHQELPSALKCLPPPPEPKESSEFSSSDVLPKKTIVPLKKSFSKVLSKKFSFSGKHQELPIALKCPPPPPEPEESSEFSSSNVLPKKTIVPLKKSFSKVLSKKFSFSGKHQELPSALKCPPPPPEPEESSEFSSSNVLPRKTIVPLKKSFSKVLSKKFSFSGNHQELPSALKCPPPPPEPEESSKFSSSNVLPKNSTVPLKKGLSRVVSKKFSFNGRPKKSSLIAPPTKFSSTGEDFKLQLQSLMETLKSTEPHYIRCVKPNNVLKPAIFENINVINQLRGGCVVEAIRISCAGYPTRHTFYEFLNLFGILSPEVLEEKFDDKVACQMILEKMEVKDYQIGKTKVFLKDGQTLDARRREVLSNAARTIQRQIRTYIARKEFVTLLQVTIHLQSLLRGKLARKLYEYLRGEAAAVKIQKTFLQYVARKHYIALQLSAVTLQTGFRAMAAHKEFRSRKQTKATMRIQAHWRCYRDYSYYKKLQKAIIVIQCGWRRSLARREYRKLKMTARETGALKEEKNKLEKKVEELTWRLQFEKRSRTDLEEAKAQEISMLKNALNAMQLQVDEANARVIRELEAAQKAIEEAKSAYDDAEAIIEGLQKKLENVADAAGREVDQLEDSVLRLVRKPSEIESENQLLHQEALPILARGNAVSTQQETVPIIQMIPVDNGNLQNGETKGLNLAVSTPQELETEERPQKSLQENQDLLIKCISQDLGYSGSRPVAACIIYKCLLHWRSFEAEKTRVFDRIVQIIGSAIEKAQDNNDVLAYWLSNSSTLLLLLQCTMKASGAASLTPQRRRSVSKNSLFGKMTQGFWPSLQNSRPLIPQQVGGPDDMRQVEAPQNAGPLLPQRPGGSNNLRQVEAKYPALLFKQQLTAFLERIYGMIRDNLKKEIYPLIGLCIQAPRTSRRRSQANAVAQQALIAYWQSIVKSLNSYLMIMKANFVPPFLVHKVFTQIFSFMNVQLFNSLLLRRECCSFSNGEFVKAGLAELEQWGYDATEEYAGSAWDEMKHIRQAVAFLVTHQKITKTLKEITNDLCPVLSIQQLYRISTMYWDDKYGTHSLSSDVISSMRVLMTEDSNNAVSSSFLLDDDSSIPFSVDNISKSMQQIDMANIGPPPLLCGHSEFIFLLHQQTKI